MMEQSEYRNVQIAGRTLTWGHAELVTFVEGSTFTDCEITLNCSASGISIGGSAFQRCRIRAAKPFANYQFFDTTFDSCRFEGSFPGCEFGYRGVFPSHVKGYVSECDFRAAMLDDVFINASDVSSLLLPPWPHFAILSPDVFSEIDLLAADPRWTLYREVAWPPETAALILRYRERGRDAFSVPEDEARSALMAHRGVRIESAA